ncbi:peroxiredoxin-like family protein [Antrihabitans sp. YC2-6]|uniref:peroxiredoxin-like family protein n=1 Tax=Antrihabitans sp. YC2-6 TaxID=2799498 RepID=UPI0018F470F0|nr:peroxiredoxin-like family protein [Antrihabitans sp. YC2-6]MBJ8348628.1 AhpC/TSA family protein [Antrihabitans sp. YC2-6]
MSRVDVISNERLIDDRHHFHEIQDFWQDGPVALVFLRQFGSAFALKQAIDLSARYSDITAAGANAVLIGLGTPIQAFTFRKRSGTRFPVLTTTDQSLYRTMGLTRGWVAATGPANLAPLIGLVRAGVYPYQPTGDNRQLGGAFVAARGGKKVVWDFRAHKASDIAPVDEIVDALVSAAALNRAVVG